MPPNAHRRSQGARFSKRCSTNTRSIFFFFFFFFVVVVVVVIVTVILIPRGMISRSI